MLHCPYPVTSLGWQPHLCGYLSLLPLCLRDRVSWGPLFSAQAQGARAERGGGSGFSLAPSTAQPSPAQPDMAEQPEWEQAHHPPPSA